MAEKIQINTLLMIMIVPVVTRTFSILMVFYDC
jgi:hypothetical protein